MIGAGVVKASRPFPRVGDSGYGLEYPIDFSTLEKASTHSKTEQAAWGKLIQAIAKTDGSPNIKRLEAGKDGAINLDELGPGDGAWVTPHRGPASGRHVLVVKRPDHSFAIIGGLHKPNTVIEGKKEYLVDKEGKTLRETTPEDYLSHLSHRHFTFKQRGQTAKEGEVERTRRQKYSEFAQRRQAAQTEYRGAMKQASGLVREHRQKLHESLGLAEGTTLAPESEEKIKGAFTKAAFKSFQTEGVPLGKEEQKLVAKFGQQVTAAFRRERRARIERVEEMVLNAARKASNGEDVDRDMARIRQVARQVAVSTAPVDADLKQALAAAQAGQSEEADRIIGQAANTAAATAFAHAEQQAMEELPAHDEDKPSDALEPGNLTGISDVPQDKIDLLKDDKETEKVDTGLNFSRVLSQFKNREKQRAEREKQQRKERKITTIPAFAQVEAEPHFESEEEQRAFFDQVGEAERNYAMARAAAMRAREQIKQVTSEMAAAGAEERPRMAVSPEEFAVSLGDIRTAMEATGVTPEDINREMELITTVSKKAKASGPGFYTAINEFWSDSTGNLLDPHMRRGSEFALAGLVAENLPKAILNSPEVQSLVGKIATKVKFNQATQRFELVGGAGQAQYGGLVQRTSGEVAPLIVARRLAQLAIRGDQERARLEEIETAFKEGNLDRQQKMDLGRERAKLQASPFITKVGNRTWMQDFMDKVTDWHSKHVLGVEDRAMKEDDGLRKQIEEIQKQTETGELLSPEEKLGAVDKISPFTTLGKKLQKTESLESLRLRRQENLGTALGSMETSAAFGVGLHEAYHKAQLAQAGATRVPEEGALGEKLRVISSPSIPTQDDVRIDLPGPVDDPNPEQRDSIRNSAKLAAYDYARNQLGFSDAEIHEVDGSAMTIPKGKMAVIGIDKNGAHVRVRVGGPLTPEDVQEEIGGKRRRPRGLMDKIKTLQVKQAAEDRYADIKSNDVEPTPDSNPPLLRRETAMRLSQYNAFKFAQQPKLFDDNGAPVRGSKGCLNTMVTGGGKTLASLAAVAGNHEAGEHMNYVVSVPKGKVQDWLKDASQFTHFATVGFTGGEAKPKPGEFLAQFEAALEAQHGEKHPTPIIVAVPDSSEGAKGFGVSGWGKEQQHALMFSLRRAMEQRGGAAGRNVIFVMDHLTDSNIHSELTKTQLPWAHQYASEYLGGPKAKEGDVLDHLSRMGVRGRIVDEPQTLISTGETSNRSNAGKRIFDSHKYPMEFRMALTATPASKALVEAFDCVKWVAQTPQIGEDGSFVRKGEGGAVQFHKTPLPSRTEFESQLGGLGRGTFTHEHLLQEQARQLFAPWNIGDEQRDRHFRLSQHFHEVTRTSSQRERQKEIEQNAHMIVQRELEKKAKELKIPLTTLLKGSYAKEVADAKATALGYIEKEHEQNINGAAPMREGSQILRRSKGAAQLPAVDHSQWSHSGKINAMVTQVKQMVRRSQAEGKDHQAVVVVDSPDQAAAVKAALEQEVFPPKKIGRNKVSQVGYLAGHVTGQGKSQVVEKPKPNEIDERKTKFASGHLKVLIIDKETAAGHNLQAADSMHMLGYLDTAGAIKQAHGRADRSPRSLRGLEEVHGEISQQLKAGGKVAEKARKAVYQATGVDPGKLPAGELHRMLSEFQSAAEQSRKTIEQAIGEDPSKMTDTQLRQKLVEKHGPDQAAAFENILDSTRDNYHKWQQMTRKLGIFTEKPLEIHTYEVTDSPHELRTADARRQQMKTLEVTTPALMGKPEFEERVQHAPTGKVITEKSLRLQIIPPSFRSCPHPLLLINLRD